LGELSIQGGPKQSAPPNNIDNQWRRNEFESVGGGAPIRRKATEIIHFIYDSLGAYFFVPSCIASLRCPSNISPTHHSPIKVWKERQGRAA